MPYVTSLWRVHCSESEAGAEVHGFDQYAASMTCMYVFFGLVFLVPMHFSWQACAGAVCMLAASALIAQAFRFQLTMRPSRLAITRTWCGIPYKWATATSLDGLRIWVMGTADWGEPGSWPMKEFCEVRISNRHCMPIGTPRTAEEICKFLNDQKTRLMSR